MVAQECLLNKSETTAEDVYKAVSWPAMISYNICSPADLVQYLAANCSEISITAASITAGAGSSWLFPKTSLTVCEQHCSKQGCQKDRCDSLHTCVYHLLSGTCDHGERCRFGHDLRTPNNLRLLELHHLEELEVAELRGLFCHSSVRRGACVPKICRFYNKPQGCIVGGNCNFLHLCWLHFDAGSGDRDCNRSHHIQAQQETILKRFGFDTTKSSQDLMQELRQCSDIDSGREAARRG